MLKEFRAFALRGNVMDLAIGVIIGGAFGKIISSLVNDIIMPVVGVVLGGADFTNLFISLDGKVYESLAKARDAGGAVFAYGNFIQNTIDFLIIALVIFFMVRAINRMTTKPAPAAAPTTKECPYCASTISIKATRCPSCTSQL